MYAYLAEFLATLFFSFIVIATGNPLAIGASLALVLLLSYRFSSTTTNPAITIALAAAGKIPHSEIVPTLSPRRISAAGVMVCTPCLPKRRRQV